MLEFLRRHSQTIMIVTVVVIISFMFWGSTTKTGVRPGEKGAEDTAFTMYGRDYSFADDRHLSTLGEAASFLRLSEFSQAMTTYSTKIVDRSRRLPVEFVFNLLVLRHELERYGIHASDAEIKQEYKDAPLFHAGGGFTPEMFEQHLSSFGLKGNDLYELLSDVVGWRKLKDVVAGNVVPPPHLAEEFYVSYYQTIKAEQITFKTEDFKKTAQVSDDQIKKYYDQKKEELKTPEKRSAAFVYFPKPQGLDKANEEERRSKNNAYGEQVNGFSAAVLKDNAKFDDLAKESKVEVKTVPEFEEASPPDAVKSEYGVVSEIFRLDPSHPISGPIEGKDGYYIVHLLKVEPRRQQELKEVETRIKDALVDQQAQENIMKAANDARKDLEAALKAGKSFDDAVKAAKLTSQPVPEFSPLKAPTDLSGGQEIAEEARKTAAGKFIKPVSTATGVILVYVASKELRKSDESANLRQRINASLDSVIQDPIFRAWWGKRKEEARINADPIIRAGASRG